jgi:hypothetical protein
MVEGVALVVQIMISNFYWSTSIDSKIYAADNTGPV